jgi:hypothetical protein
MELGDVARELSGMVGFIMEPPASVYFDLDKFRCSLWPVGPGVASSTAGRKLIRSHDSHNTCGMFILNRYALGMFNCVDVITGFI